MPRRLAAARLTAAAVATAVLWPAAAVADAPQVNAALLFLQATCGIRDARLESRRAEGRLLLTLRTPQFTRQTNLVHNDLRQFTEEAMKKNSEMPPELGACFDPASNQVINVLMELPPNVASLPLAPPPAPPAAAQSGGYVPPQIAAPAPMTVQATPAAPVAPGQMSTEGTILADGGPVRVKATRMDVQPRTPGNWAGEVFGRIDIDITNLTQNPIRVALGGPLLVIVGNDGLEFHFHNATGLHVESRNCGYSESSFTQLRPGRSSFASLTFKYMNGGRDNTNPTAGRVNGTMLVYDDVKNSCIKEPLAERALPIQLMRGGSQAAATSPQAAPAPTAAATTDAPSFSIQSCRTAARNVVCEVKIANNSGRDQWIVVHGRQTVLFDPSGGAHDLDDARMANQGGLNWQSNIGKVRVIHDTAPIMHLTFRNVPESVQTVKRLEVSIGYESPDGQRLSKLTIADAPIQGR
jgi:hypothetical protein